MLEKDLDFISIGNIKISRALRISSFDDNLLHQANRPRK